MKRLLLLSIIILIIATPQIHIGESVSSAHLYGKTYADLERFLASDDTHLNTWTPDFNCVKFTYEMIDHAKSQGWVVIGVLVVFNNVVTGEKHEFVDFWTSDRGEVWIEPQENAEYKIITLEDTNNGPAPLCFKQGGCWYDKVVRVLVDAQTIP